MSTPIPTVERWGVFELSLPGPAAGNPFLEVSFGAIFQHDGQPPIEVDGFYDGAGLYRVRFMPDYLGEWRYTTRSSSPHLHGAAGAFACTAPTPANHGPVRVHNGAHFAYADGTPYFPFGTTCYAWAHQGDALEEQTLATLAAAPFNKLRMCVFPKDYIYNQNEPPLHPFERSADGAPDAARPNPAFFRRLEDRVAQLGALGIEADVILFHPYDRWGYSELGQAGDERYLRYLVARIGAFRHVWWSMANEYDFMLDTKPAERWERLFATLQSADPYGRLCSIHNGSVKMAYDHSKPWISHVSLQDWSVRDTRLWRERYGKPVVNDECEYEGNLHRLWGGISAQELVHRCWSIVVSGAYAGHGETYLHPDELLWWSKGGRLHGESWRRIAFLRRIIEESVSAGLTPLQGGSEWGRLAGSRDGDTRLIYFGPYQPAQWYAGLPDDDDGYEAEVIDTWEMTVAPAPLIPPPAAIPVRGVPRAAGVAFGVALPGKPYLALRVRRRR